MAIALLRREPSGDAPDFPPPPPRLWTLSTHGSINAPVARTLIGLTGLGVAFYIGIVIIVGDVVVCVSIPDTSIHRSSWSMEEGSTWDRVLYSSIVHSKWVLSRTHRMWKQRFCSKMFRFNDPNLCRFQIIPQNPESLLALDNVPQPEPWLKPKELGTIRRTNTSDARCMSWVLRNITDPEALDKLEQWMERWSQ